LIFWILTFKNFSVALAKRSRFFSWCILFYFSTIFTILMKIKCFSIFSRQYWTINLTLLSHPWGMKKWLVYRGWPVYRTKIVLIVSIGDWKSYPLTPLCIASPYLSLIKEVILVFLENKHRLPKSTTFTW